MVKKFLELVKDARILQTHKENVKQKITYRQTTSSDTENLRTENRQLFFKGAVIRMTY